MTDLDGLATDDRTLLDRWRENRDGDAFAEIARRHSPVVFDLTVRVLGDRSSAEDILQEALLALALETTAKPADVGVIAWLARFAICRARNKRSSERCRTRRQIVVGSERPEDVMPEERLEHSDELEHALRGCDPEDRALLAMRFLHDWDYDRIASALSISEGAARVRVHRALNTVRAKALGTAAGRAPAGDGAIASRLAMVPVAPLAAGELDATIASTIELAKVRLGAPPNGVEHRTASSPALHAAVRLAGAAFSLVIAAAFFGEGSASRDAATVASARTSFAATLGAPADGPWQSLRDGNDTAGGDARETRGPGARPWDWDGGALDRLADVGRATPRSPASRTAGGGPGAAPAASANAAPNVRADGPLAPAAAEARGDERTAAAEMSEESSPDASRPASRGTRAAKGETVSSEGERAGASGVSPPAPAPAAAAGESSPAGTAVRNSSPGGGAARSVRSRTPAPVVQFVPLDELPADQRALVDEAGDLLRRYLEARGDDLAAAAGAPVDAKQLRAVRSTYSKLRRAAVGSADRAAGRRGRGAEAGGVAVGRLVSLLTRVEFGAPADAGPILFPQGADVASSLSEVIRVLGAATQNLAAVVPVPGDAAPDSVPDTAAGSGD